MRKAEKPAEGSGGEATAGKALGNWIAANDPELCFAPDLSVTAPISAKGARCW
jgi:hypothetical protein